MHKFGKCSIINTRFVIFFLVYILSCFTQSLYRAKFSTYYSILLGFYQSRLLDNFQKIFFEEVPEGIHCKKCVFKKGSFFIIIILDTCKRSVTRSFLIIWLHVIRPQSEQISVYNQSKFLLRRRKLEKNWLGYYKYFIGNNQ